MSEVNPAKPDLRAKPKSARRRAREFAMQGLYQWHVERPLNEVSIVEMAVLYVAAFEIVSMPETPYPVIINEAIELTKSFGGADGHRFVNGVLDKLAALVRADEFAAAAAKRRNA